MSLPRQLLLLVGLSAAVAIFASLTYHVALKQSMQCATSVTQSAVSGLTKSYDLLDQISKSQSALQRLLREKDPDEIEKAIAQLESTQKETQALIAGCGPNGRNIEKNFQLLLPLQRAVVDQILLGNVGLANEKFLAVFTPQNEALLKEVDRFSEWVEKETNARLDAQERVTRISLLWRGCTVAAVVVAMVLVGWRIKTSIARHLKNMADRLSQASEALVTSSRQISASSQSLAEGASEQAGAFEQTAASLEEIASMASQNAENAAASKSLTQETRQAAETGSANMQDMNVAMADIQSASSNIALIIKTIDGIAFQTNILALNAAVEAARAGVAGAGFAVVADEVRNLAQRSARAAKETAEKIDHSIAMSANGVQISNKVAENLNLIVAKARLVDELVAKIASDSGEQSRGIDQVKTAVTHLDKVTQGSAASAEESATASDDLTAQASSLSELVVNLQKLVTGHARQHPHSSAGPARPDCLSGGPIAPSLKS